MSDDRPTDERSALAWIMSGTVGVLVVGGLAKHLIDKRRDRTVAEIEGRSEPEGTEPEREPEREPDHHREPEPQPDATMEP